MKFWRCILTGVLVFLAFADLAAEEQALSPRVDDRDVPNIYLDCNRCDFDYLRENITFVNYVRDRKDALVHIIVSTQRTGGGGREYTLIFHGQKQYEGKSDTLSFITEPEETDDSVRRKMAHTIRLGMVRYVAGTSVGKFLSVQFNSPRKPAEVRDRWNYWVFRTRFRSFANGQKSTNFFNLNGSVSASRVTDAWKVNLTFGTNYSENRFDVSSGTFRSIDRENWSYGLIVKSIDEHWSVGAFADASSSTRRNVELDVMLAPAIEYNLFPYSESTHRQLRILYQLGYNGFRYSEVTIYDKISEDLVAHQLGVALEAQQTWGSVDMSVRWSQYLNDLSKNRLRIRGGIALQLFRGFSLEIDGNYEQIRDQLFLPKSSIPDEDILLRRRELETSYRYFTSIGIRYTFGSKFSNVVNPRFSG